jgi:hypothetical protein
LEFAGKQNLNRRGRFRGVSLAKGCQDNLGGVLEIATGQGYLTIELSRLRPRRHQTPAPIVEAVDGISRRV